MTEQGPALGAWHPDPFGRAQLRYWDGSGWTGHVSTNGQQATDPLPVLGAGVLDQSQLVLEYDSPDTVAGWRVWDAQSRQVAVVTGSTGWQFGPKRYALIDAAGWPLVVVREGGLSNPGILVADPRVGELGKVSGFGTRFKSNYDLHWAGSPVGRVDIKTSRWGIDATVVDRTGRAVATVRKGVEQLTTFRYRAWLTLDRDPGLADPLRFLAVATPLALHMDLSRREKVGDDSWDPL